MRIDATFVSCFKFESRSIECVRFGAVSFVSLWTDNNFHICSRTIVANHHNILLFQN